MVVVMVVMIVVIPVYAAEQRIGRRRPDYNQNLNKTVGKLLPRRAVNTPADKLLGRAPYTVAGL